MTTRLIASLPFASKPTVLDVGASDGIAALSLIRQVPFARYYVTDTRLTTRVDSRCGSVYFYQSDGQASVLANAFFIAYNSMDQAIWPLGGLARLLFTIAPKIGLRSRSVSLVNPELSALASEDLIIREYDVFQSWDGEQVDLVIVANVLNRSYFGDAQIAVALSNLKNALRQGGRLVIVENRDEERSDIFQLSQSRLERIGTVGSGCAIRDLVETA